MLEKIKLLSLPSLLLLVILISPVFLTGKIPIEEKEIIRKSPTYYTVIPDKAVSLKEIDSFIDKELKEKKSVIKEKTQLKIVSLEESGNKKIFKLSNDSYILASSENIGSDVILTEEDISTTVYVTKDVNVLYSPMTTFNSEVYQKLSGNQSLQAKKRAETYWGTYYEVSFDLGRTGWIDADAVSLENPKLTALQKTLTKKYGSNKNISITVKILDKDFTATVNSDKMIYSASLWKIPILYWTQKEINAGRADLSDKLKYIPEVNNSSKGAFKTSGTGSMAKKANNKSYQLFDLINKTAKESDNVASNILAYYETDMFSKDFQAGINEQAGANWSVKSREANSTMVANTLQALYHEGGASFNALFETSYDTSRIMKDLPDEVKVAHKIGITDEENHDAAIVFTDQPYILVVMTTNNQSDEKITEISNIVYEALK
ncbi:MAG: serine hydrolase [Lactovum sp.]